MLKKIRFLVFAKVMAVCVIAVSCSINKPKENKKVEAKRRPNILFIMTDDHTTQAMSCYGSKLINTPNLDNIAKEGMQFNHCYVTNAICAPSRAVILTGKFSHQNGVTNNRDEFDGEQVTYPKLLRNAGYETAMIGKWHLGSTPTGFDYWSVLPGQGDYYQPEFIEMGKTITEDGYVTDIITNKAISWLENRDESKPFAMVYQQKAPHRNWIPAPRHLGIFEDKYFPEPESLFDKYEGRGAAASGQKMEIKNHMWDAWDFKLASKEELEQFAAKNSIEAIENAKKHDVDGANNRDKDLEKLFRVYDRMTHEQKAKWHNAYANRLEVYQSGKLTGDALLRWKYQLYMRDYLSCLVSLDENVGRLIGHLKETNQLDNTIVIYTSDQGFFLGEHGWFDKRFMYEESYRMPLIIRYPERIMAGTTTDAMVMNIDFAPTLLDLAGVAIPDDMQGKSLVPVFDGKGEIPERWRDATYYHYYEYPSWHSVKRHYGIRISKYKLIHFYDDIDEWELYDVKNDPGELKNLYGVAEYTGIIKSLKNRLKELQLEYKDTDPMEENTKYFRNKTL